MTSSAERHVETAGAIDAISDERRPGGSRARLQRQRRLAGHGQVARIAS